MTYNEDEFNSIFLKENKYTNHVPAYIREYPKFFKLLKLFSNYISIANDYLEVILNQLNLSNAHGAILEKIAERLDIYIEKPVDSSGNYNKSTYEEMLKIAILGNGLKRNSKSDRNSINKIKDIFKSIKTIEIIDYAKGKVKNSEKNLNMFIDFIITGTNDLWSPAILEKYVLPNITGVRTLGTYLLNNNIYFGFDRQDVITIIGNIDVITENVTVELLDARVNELNVKKTVGVTLKDASNNYWTYVSGDDKWVNNGASVVEGSNVIDESVGYSIQGWDKGRWAKINIIK